MGIHTRRGGVAVRTAIVATLAVVVLLVFATSAFAAPTEPTLTLDELRAKLAAGPMSGYLKTVVHGYTIEKIPVTVEDIAELSWGSLILAEASGPVIDELGAVAKGMSGSPVYVADGGVDKLIGALSYGGVYGYDNGGLFMATPIDYMSALESTYVKPPAAGTYALAEPVRTGGGRVESLVIAKGGTAAQVDAGAGELVMEPLAFIEIGGLPPQTRAYKELAAKLAKQTGLSIAPAVGAGFWTGPPAPPLEAGSSICQLFSQGAVWYGAMGTATYVNGSVAVAFGHPSWWTGSCGAAMTAGYVSTLWPNEYAPYKMIAPRDIKGTIVQDRNWGLVGIVGRDPDMIPVTSQVAFPEEGRTVETDSTAAEWAFQTPGYEDLAGYLVMQALWDACDAYSMPGSAVTTTTIRVSDETGPYTVTMDDLWDSYDITWDPVFEVFDALYSLSADPDGVLDVRLDSVDFKATVSSARKSARLVEIVVPDGLKTGDNVVQLTYYGYGSRELKTLTTTLTIPEGKPVNGTIEVVPGSWSDWDVGEGIDGANDDTAPKTLAEIVDELNEGAKNSDLTLTFSPREEGGGPQPTPELDAPSVRTSAPSTGADTRLDPVVVTIPTGWVFQDTLSVSTVPVTLDAIPARVDLEQPVLLSGTVQSVTADVPVSLYRVDAATGKEYFLGTVTATYADGIASFETEALPARHNTTFIARVGAEEGWLPGSADASVKVRAAVQLSRRVDGHRVWLGATVWPRGIGGRVAFQRYVDGRWLTVRTCVVQPSGFVSTVQRLPGEGRYRFRAKFLGNALNAASTSVVRTAVIR